MDKRFITLHLWSRLVVRHFNLPSLGGDRSSGMVIDGFPVPLTLANYPSPNLAQCLADVADFTQEQTAIRDMLLVEMAKLREVIQEVGGTADSNVSRSFLLQMTAVYSTHNDSKHHHRREAIRSGLDVSSDVYLGSFLSEYLHFSRAVYAKDVVVQLGESWRMVGGRLVARPGLPAHAMLLETGGDQRAVLAVRGTKSFADALTNVLAAHMPFGQELVSEGEALAHSGFVHSARAVLDNMQPQIDRVLAEKRPLVITGHSLGAGTAAIIAVELAMRYPELLSAEGGSPRMQCVAFACPAVASAPLCDAVNGFITSVINCDDCIPRASVNNFVNLFNEIAVADSTDFMHQMAARALDTAETRLDAHGNVDFSAQKTIQHLRNKLRERDRLGHNDLPSSLWSCSEKALLPPGRVIHLIRSADTWPPCSAVDVTNMRDNFGELRLTKRMMSDHSRHAYFVALQTAFLRLL